MMIEQVMRMLARIPGAQITVEHNQEQEDRVQAVELYVDSLLIRAEHIARDGDERRSVDRK